MRTNNRLVQFAQDYLKESPFDAGHDLEHHARVVGHCKRIVKEEKLTLDWKALETAAWWHDIERKDLDKNNKLLRNVARENGISMDLADRAIGILNKHSFGNEQDDLESNVLFDADKIEYVSVQRYERVFEAVRQGAMSKEVWNRYKTKLGERIPHIPTMLHFSVSKQIFRDQLAEVQQAVKLDKKYYGLEFLLKLSLL